MEKEFVSFEIALALKELGFDEEVLRYYDDETKEFCDIMKIVKAPLLQQAFRFFDDNTDYKGFIVPSIKEECFDWEIHYDGNKILECNEYYSLRKNAELECLVKLIEIAKEKNVK